MNKRYLTIKEASDYSQFKSTIIMRAINTGKLIALKEKYEPTAANKSVKDGRILIPIRAFESFCDECDKGLHSDLFAMLCVNPTAEAKSESASELVSEDKITAEMLNKLRVKLPHSKVFANKKKAS